MKRFYYLSIISVFFISIAYSQIPTIEKVPVVLKVFRLPQLEMDIIVKDSISYLPVKGMFDHIGIQADIDSSRKFIRGFFQNSDATYTIDLAGKVAKKKKQSFFLTDEDAVVQEGVVYLRTEFLNDFFKIGFKYNPRLLTVTVDSFHVLPAVKYRRLQQNFLARRERGGLQLPANDFFIDRDPWTTGAGRFNYNIMTRYNASDFYSNYNFSSQSKVLGGDLDFYLRGVSYPRRRKNTNPTFNAQYRIPFPDNNAVQQIIIGNRASNGLFAFDVLSVEVTNRPLAGRIIHTTETFSSVVTPHSNVEFMGGISGVQFAEADDNGRYTMDAPIRYGRNELQFLSYDKYGRSDIRRYYINIPQSMIRPGEVEYSTSFGKLSDVSDQYVSTNYVKVGLSSNLTAGAIVDYYKVSPLSQKWYGGITTTAHIFRALDFTGSVSPNAYSQMGLQWLPTSLSEISVNRYWYSRNNPFNFGNARDRWQVLAAFPLLPKNNVRVNINGDHTQYVEYQNYTIAASLNGIFGNIFPGISTRLLRNDISGSTNTMSHSTDFSLGAILPLNVIFNSNISYDHLIHDVQSLRFTVAKTLFNRLHVHLSFQRFPIIPMGIVTLDLRYIFPFLDVRTSVARNDERAATYAVNLIGSMGFDIPKASVAWYHTTSRAAMSGFRLRPFIDENNNNIRDNGEQVIESGRIYVQDNFVGLPPAALSKNKFTIDRLNSYKSYSIYLDPTSIEDPRIVPKFNSIRLFSEANYTRDVDLPLVFAGTIRGIVVDTANMPQEGVTVILTPLIAGVKDPSKLIKKTSTFSTGEFEFALLNPGRYNIEIDPSQVTTYGLKSKPAKREVLLVSKPDGDVSDNQNFQLIIR